MTDNIVRFTSGALMKVKEGSNQIVLSSILREHETLVDYNKYGGALRVVSINPSNPRPGDSVIMTSTGLETFPVDNVHVLGSLVEYNDIWPFTTISDNVGEFTVPSNAPEGDYYMYLQGLSNIIGVPDNNSANFYFTIGQTDGGNLPISDVVITAHLTTTPQYDDGVQHGAVINVQFDPLVYAPEYIAVGRNPNFDVTFWAGDNELNSISTSVTSAPQPLTGPPMYIPWDTDSVTVYMDINGTSLEESGTLVIPNVNEPATPLDIVLHTIPQGHGHY